ncbi:MAG: hypothetical protein WCA09_17940 [Burkholderiales bacterium]
MTPLYVYPAAIGVGVLFNINPSCGSATLVWTSTQAKPWSAATLALIRITVLAVVGAVAGYFGTTARAPWGVLMVGAAAYLLYTTIQQVRLGRGGACVLPPKTSALPWVLAVIPPPSGYIGLAIMYGGFGAPSPVEGALTLALVGIGLTLPVWIMILRPAWWTTVRNSLASNSRLLQAQITYQFLGAGILMMVGLAFIFVHGFHRPLLDLIR